MGKTANGPERCVAICSSCPRAVLEAQAVTPSVVSEVFLLVEQIRPGGTEIYDLRAAISVLFQSYAAEAVESVRDTLLRA